MSLTVELPADKSKDPSDKDDNSVGVELMKTGFLNHYAPTFKNIQKDLERLNTKQEVITVDIATENQKIKDLVVAGKVDERLAVITAYKEKLDRQATRMKDLTDRSLRLKQKAERLQEIKQEEALQREIRKAQAQEREQMLIAQNDPDSAK